VCLGRSHHHRWPFYLNTKHTHNVCTAQKYYIVHRTKIIRNLITVDLTTIFTDLLIIACAMRIYVLYCNDDDNNKLITIIGINVISYYIAPSERLIE